MERNEKIPIQNIYYMLSYAYKTIQLSEYKKMNIEEFHNVKDLYAEILKVGIPNLIRNGLVKDYVRISDCSTVVRGKIDINSSIKQNALVDKKLVVLYDEYTEDILLNQIIKATLVYLTRTTLISKEKRKDFYGFLPYFSEVSDIELNSNVWKEVQYNRQNIRYQFTLDVCRYLYEDLLLDESSKDTIMRQVKDDQRLSSLYEKFVFAFYKRETNYKVSHPQISWKIENNFAHALPVMQTDIVLSKGNRTLIIDTKFYSENMARRFKDSEAKQKSGNLYQIFTYVNNWSSESEEVVGGMLLYAKTTDKNQPNHHYEINGNRISVVNLDLCQDFNGIKENLFSYADEFFRSELVVDS